jgi:hypothetical protein
MDYFIEKLEKREEGKQRMQTSNHFSNDHALTPIQLNQFDKLYSGWI